MVARDSLRWVRGACDYRLLTAKRDQLAFPLDHSEQARLCELTQLFTQEAAREDLPWSQRDQYRAPVSLLVRYGDAIGQAHDISGEGVFVITRFPLAVGARTILRISGRPLSNDDHGRRLRDPDEGADYYEEWQFAAEVVRVEALGMALRFVGIPLLLRIHGSEPRPPLQRAA